MNEERNEQVWPIRSPWRDLLLETVEQVRHTLLLVSPFLTEDVIAALETVLAQDAKGQAEHIDIRLLTRLRLEDLKAGASSLSALQRLLQWPGQRAAWRSQVRVIDNLHAKVWVFDDQIAFVGSGNATHSGLEVNIEYGLAVKEPQLVAQILADWQPYWEQATPVTLADLAPISTALQSLRTDPTLTALEQKIAQRHDSLIEELQVTPRFGKKIALPGTHKRRFATVTPYVKEHALPPEAAEASPKAPSPESPATYKNIPLPMQRPIVIPPNTIFLARYDFWRALNWTFPSLQQVLWQQPDAYLRIDWFATSSELQLTRANQAQLSRATIKAYTQEETLENRHITLNRYALQELCEALQANPADSPTTSIQSSWLDYQLALAAWPEHIGATPVAFDINEQTLASRSTDSQQRIQNIPPLQKPVSHITIKHTTLVEQLEHLTLQWQRKHAETTFPAIVELRFSLSESESGIVLSTGPLDQRLEIFVPGNDSVFTDSSLTLRLSTPALWQVLDSTLHLVEQWYLQIGYDASALQLQPVQEAPEKAHLWFHQLNTMD